MDDLVKQYSLLEYLCPVFNTDVSSVFHVSEILKYWVNWNILVTQGKEIERDYHSSGERFD